MNILLIGDESKILEAMIDKLNKCDHRIYWLTGKKGKDRTRKQVFEKYNFSYTDSNVKDIIESVKPDAVLFMGAYDTSFDWRYDGHAEAVRYTTSLVNILSSYALGGKGRFIYLSSQEVYDGAYANDIPEDTAVSVSGFKAPAISQGEVLCENYRIQGVDTIILRMDQIYHVPKKEQKDGSRCFEMCVEALKTGKITANSKKSFSMLYINDAVELIYQVIKAEQTMYSCYHISSMQEINEIELAELIKKQMGEGITVVDQLAGENQRRVLDGRRYQKEFGQKIFTNYDKGVELAAEYMKRHSDNFIKETDVGGDWSGKLWHDTKVIFRRLLPFIESIICFVPFFMLNNMASGSQYFGKLDFYLLYVLLFAIVHGQHVAIFSALLAGLGYCFRQSYGSSGYEVLLDYNTYVWLAQLFIVGMTVGYLRDHLRSVREDMGEEIHYLHDKLEGIAEINNSNVRIKQNFEEQLVNQRDSLGKIYEITSRLEKYEPAEVLFYAAKMLAQLMNSKDVAVYTVANENYARLFSATSPDARKLGYSIEYTALEEMYSELSEGRVFINKTMNEKLPVLASAIYSEQGMELILMVWGIPWQRMTLAEANRLTIIGTLIQNATVRASNYMDSLREQRYVTGTNVLNEEAFGQLITAFFGAKAQGLTECALVEVMTGGQDRGQAAAILHDSIRPTDYLGVLEDGHLYALLSNTDNEGAVRVTERFLKLGYESLLKEAVV